MEYLDQLETPSAIIWPTLVITTRDGSCREFTITKSMIHIGRSRSVRNDIVLLNDGRASKVHARIERERDGKYTLYDLDSTNGVTINGILIQGNHVLKDRDVILIGAATLVFQSPGESLVMESQPPEALSLVNINVAADPLIGSAASMIEEAAHVDAIPEKARLIDEAGGAHILAFETLIGRSPTADLVLDDASVSIQHARINASDTATYYVEDLGSENGTSINGRLLAAGQRSLLANGDVLRFGLAELRFEFSTRYPSQDMP